MLCYSLSFIFDNWFGQNSWNYEHYATNILFKRSRNDHILNKKKQNSKFKQIQISAEAYVLNFTYILVVLQFQEERISPVL